MRTTLIIAPTQQAAAALKYAYGDSPEIRVTALQSIMGHRGDRIVVLPFPATASETERATRDRIMREQILAKTFPGCELIIL